MKIKQFALFVTIFAAASLFAESSAVIRLPAPAIDPAISFKQAISMRKTDRTFSVVPLTPQDLSNILWAANGINRTNGKRTVPAARGIYAISLYVATAHGVFRHDIVKNTLTQVTSKDMRAFSDGRKMGAKAPLVIVMVAKHNIFGKSRAGSAYVGVETGAIMQNIYLYCAGAKLNTVACGSFDPAKWHQALKLPADESVILTQIIGR